MVLMIKKKGNDGANVLPCSYDSVQEVCFFLDIIAVEMFAYIVVNSHLSTLPVALDLSLEKRTLLPFFELPIWIRYIHPSSLTVVQITHLGKANVYPLILLDMLNKSWNIYISICLPIYTQYFNLYRYIYNIVCAWR